MAYDDVVYEIKNQVSWIPMKGPDRGNTSRRQTVLELIHALDEARNDPARHNGATGLSRVAIDRLVAHYYHSEEAKEMAWSFNAKGKANADRFYR
jgi:hypothetical protein